MATDTTPKKKEPTAQEAMFFFAIVKHTRNKADIDWKAVAVEQGFKNAEVAKVRFGQVKRKLGISSDAGPVAATPPMSSRTPTKKTGSLTGTPTRVAKTSGRAGTKGKAPQMAAKKEEGESAGEEDGHDADADDDDETLAGVKEELEEGEEEDAEDVKLNRELPTSWRNLISILFIVHFIGSGCLYCACDDLLGTMPPRKGKSTTTATTEGETPLSVGLTDSEMRFIKAAMNNMTQRFDANWDGVATDLGLKDAKCAKERFRQMSVRHGWRDQPSGNGSPRKGGAAGSSAKGKVSKRAPRTPTKKAFKSAALVLNDDDEDSVKGEPEMEEPEMEVKAGDEGDAEAEI
ncbi:hypothetical protein E4U43_000133 [Claviceps pusilla]|uniref:Myb-like domain-containing protein n=1 Tax=Claviceps pusilla TaxID=123648 RepID=A0A9P7NCG9_9HYPO|nr:hypothetical protein E4U43_000133 [Claviceps pusilla]